jgi:hypothetical protein
VSNDQIDWRNEFAALRPYFNKKGGVVHIRYHGSESAPNAFLMTLKWRFEKFRLNESRASVRIDPEIGFTTHYTIDVMQTIANKVGYALESSGALSATFNIASGNTSQAGMDVDVGSIHIDALGHADAPMIRDRRITQLVMATRRFLSNGHFMIVLNDCTMAEQAFFWRDLWAKGFNNLTADGLLLVKMVDSEKQNQSKHPDEPEPTIRLSLPVEYDDSRQLDVVEDLAAILVREIKREKNLDLAHDDAIRRVQGVVFSHKGDISRLHREWSGVLQDLVKNAT